MTIKPLKEVEKLLGINFRLRWLSSVNPKGKPFVFTAIHNSYVLQIEIAQTGYFWSVWKGLARPTRKFIAKDIEISLNIAKREARSCLKKHLYGN